MCPKSHIFLKPGLLPGQEVPRLLVILGWAHLPGADSFLELNNKGPGTQKSDLFWRLVWDAKVENWLNCQDSGFPSPYFLGPPEVLCICLGFSTWKMRRTLQSEQGFWLCLQCGMCFIIFPEPSFPGFHKRLMILGVSVKVTLACILSIVLPDFHLVTEV